MAPRNPANDFFLFANQVMVGSALRVGIGTGGRYGSWFTGVLARGVGDGFGLLLISLPKRLPHLPRLMFRALAVLLVLLLAPLAGWADSLPEPIAYRCDGEPLSALVNNGAVDTFAIPNTTGGTVPGAFVVLQWRDITLQLPRTNNAGAPSFTDGKWWWSLEDPAHPRFRLRRGAGDLQDFACERL